MRAELDRIAGVGRAWTLALGLACAACGEGGDQGPVELPVAEVPTRVVATGDGRLTVALPYDLVLSIFDRAILGTSADGSFRVYLERRDGAELRAVAGELEEELLGLGWELELEKHYEAAVQLQLAHGARNHRTARGVWIVEKKLGDTSHTVICDGLGRDAQAERVGSPLRVLCQSLAFPEATPP